ncbi:hypothetical protein EBZ35_04750, partial [bacterium]|nr:hypothetical protein [bacterium]
GAEGFGTVLGVTVNSNTPRLVGAMRDHVAGAKLIMIDGAVLNQDAAGRAGVDLTAPTRLSLGADFINSKYYTGSIGEVLIFNSVLGIQDRYILNQYLATQWGLQLDTDGDGIMDAKDAFPTDNRKILQLATDVSRNNTVAGLSPSGSASLKVWLDASDGQSVIRNAFNSVGAWLDLTDNQNHAASVLNPTYVPNTLNGLGAIRFSGGQYLTIPYRSEMNGNAFTIIIVGKGKAGSGKQTVISAMNGVAKRGWQVQWEGNLSSWQGIVGNAANWVTISSNYAVSSESVGVMTLDYDGVQLRAMGQAMMYGMVSGELAVNTTESGLIGAGLNASNGITDYLNGDIGEMLYFNRALSTADRWVVNRYLSAKWQVGTDTDFDGISDEAERVDGTDPLVPNSPTGKSNLMAWYGFNGNALDASGFSNHATITQNVTLVPDRFGVPNRAYSFNGINSYIQTPVFSNWINQSASVWFRTVARSMADMGSQSGAGTSTIRLM